MHAPFFIALHQGLDTILVIAIVVVFLQRVGARLQLGQVMLGTIIGFTLSLGLACFIVVSQSRISLTVLDGTLAVIHLLAGGALLAVVGWMCEQCRIIRTGDFAAAAYARGYIIAGAIVLAILHQGIELALHVYDVAHASVLTSATSLAGYILAGVIGVGAYRALRALPLIASIVTAMVVVSVIATGMWAMAVHYAEMAGIVPTLAPLWDTSGWIAEESLTGHMLQTFAGYVAAPSSIVVGAYLIAWGVIIFNAHMRRCAWFRA